jgi:hypothetical protein
MQFIEASMFGVRSARLTFGSRTSATRVTLFPMVHVGVPEFYEATYDDALTHEVVLFEGVRSPVTVRVTRSYRWLVGSRAMVGLVVQPRLPTGGARGRIIHADLTAEEFAREWNAVPLWVRMALYVVAPLIGLQRRWFSTRAKLAKDLSFDDQPSLAEVLALTPESGALTQAILHARDDRLLERLGAELDAKTATAKTIAVVYGAAHMRAVVRELTTNRDFFVESAEWRTLFALT